MGARAPDAFSDDVDEARRLQPITGMSGAAAPPEQIIFWFCMYEDYLENLGKLTLLGEGHGEG